MISTKLQLQNFIKPRLLFRNSSTALDIEKLEREGSQESTEIFTDEAALREAEIEKKRNKSRLSEQDRNTVLGKPRYTEPKMWFHNTIKYNRRLYGMHGSESGVDPSICWPTKQELADKIEYERVAYPFTIQEMIESNRLKKKEREERIMKRQVEVVEKMKKLDGWIKEVEAKAAKKEADAKEARDRRERLIEEVKAHFGYTVDPRDDKFKEMLEKKEKEQRKAMKEAKKKAAEQKLMEKLLKKP